MTVLNARISNGPLVKDEAASEVGVEEYTGACPNGCGWQLMAQWQPARELYLLFSMPLDDAEHDDSEEACNLENVQIIAEDKLRSHLTGCGNGLSRR